MDSPRPYRRRLTVVSAYSRIRNENISSASTSSDAPYEGEASMDAHLRSFRFQNSMSTETSRSIASNASKTVMVGELSTSRLESSTRSRRPSISFSLPNNHEEVTLSSPNPMWFSPQEWIHLARSRGPIADARETSKSQASQESELAYERRIAVLPPLQRMLVVLVENTFQYMKLERPDLDQVNSDDIMAVFEEIGSEFDILQAILHCFSSGFCENDEKWQEHSGLRLQVLRLISYALQWPGAMNSPLLPAAIKSSEEKVQAAAVVIAWYIIELQRRRHLCNITSTKTSPCTYCNVETILKTYLALMITEDPLDFLQRGLEIQALNQPILRPELWVSTLETLRTCSYKLLSTGLRDMVALLADNTENARKVCSFVNWHESIVLMLSGSRDVSKYAKTIISKVLLYPYLNNNTFESLFDNMLKGVDPGMARQLIKNFVKCLSTLHIRVHHSEAAWKNLVPLLARIRDYIFLNKASFGRSDIFASVQGLRLLPSGQCRDETLLINTLETVRKIGVGSTDTVDGSSSAAEQANKKQCLLNALNIIEVFEDCAVFLRCLKEKVLPGHSNNLAIVRQAIQFGQCHRHPKARKACLLSLSALPRPSEAVTSDDDIDVFLHSTLSRGNRSTSIMDRLRTELNSKVHLLRFRQYDYSVTGKELCKFLLGNNIVVREHQAWLIGVLLHNLGILQHVCGKALPFKNSGAQLYRISPFSMQTSRKD